MKDTQWYKLTIKGTLSSLETTEHGLSGEEAKSRLARFGPNRIKEEKKASAWLLLKAEKALEALKKMATLKTRVVREGKEKEIPTEDLVPGDIILLKVGDKIPADGRLLEAINMKTDEASLTGESQTTEKTTQAIQGQEVPVGDRKNMVFMETSVSYGRRRSFAGDDG